MTKLTLGKHHPTPTGQETPMTETYFKAVRPDGTDFFTGTVRWLPPVGESLPKKGLVVTHPTSRKKSTGGADEYLSVATVPTDCTGMEWPCRLARVERTRAAVWTPDADSLPYKRVSWRWRVVEELDPTLAFGPQGADVAAIIDRVTHLTDGEAEALDASWEAARGAAWEAARGAAQGAAWVARGVRDAAWEATRDAVWAAGAARAARVAAWAAARDAVLATITRDLISEATYQTLIGPWHKVIGKKA